MAKAEPRRERMKVLIVTGSRSEFGLLRPVIEAAAAHRELRLSLCVAGEHLVTGTVREVERTCAVDHRVAMQKLSDRGRLDHAAAFARGAAGFARVLRKERPAWLVVLGDRIEAFAAASAAAVAGVAVCHIHGGDRAEGIADEAMRHAISKLAQLHCAATKTSAARLIRMGEASNRVKVTGSPAIDDLGKVRLMSETGRMPEFIAPRAVVLLHPGGFGGREREAADASLRAVRQWMGDSARAWSVVLLPNTDPGREAIVESYARAEREMTRADAGVPLLFMYAPMHRREFLPLLAELRAAGGVLIGNSSAGLIEAAAIGVPVVNLGDRQAGRERGANVVQCDSLKVEAIVAAIRRATRKTPPRDARYGRGDTGVKIARLLARGPDAFGGVGKRNAY